MMDKSVEDIVLYNGNIRGMDKLREVMPENYISDTAREILDMQKGTVFLASGFYVKGHPETDGPAGTWAIAKALEKLGYRPVIITDELCRGIFEDEELEVEYAAYDFDEKSADLLLDKYKPVVMISLERCGPNSKGEYANMRGVSISEYTAPIDILFTKASGGILTVGIGDGGNEIGMGNVADTIRGKLSIEPCITRVGRLIISTVSNWGGYALCACWQKMTGINVLPSSDEAVGFMERASKYGCVDGISGENVIMEDGYNPKITSMILSQLRDYSKE